MPNARWEIISTDFVVKLSKSMEFNTVIIAVNSVFKRTHFIPTHTMVTVEDAAKFSLHHTWKLYSLSNYIVSD